MKHFLFVILVITFASSCSIQKRVHRKGYSISWSKNYSTEKLIAEKSQSVSEKQSEKKSTEEVDVVLQPLKSIVHLRPQKRTIDDTESSETRREHLFVEKEKKSFRYGQKLESDYSSLDPNNSEEGKKVEGFGVAGLISVLTGLVMAFFISILIGMVLAVIGIVFGAIGIRRYMNDPKKYGGNGMAIASLALGIILMLACIVLLVILL